MTAAPAVIDTNVVVSGLLTANPDSPTARILDGMIAARFRFLLSVELLAEYRDVILRPRIARRHSLAAKDIDVILTDITAAASFLRPEQLGPRPSGGDGHLWQLLDAVPAAVLVTGDRRLFDTPGHDARVVDPRAFADSLDLS